MEPHETFLLEDFKQYHEWMRHYDKSFFGMIGFLYSGYAAIIVATYALYSKFPNQNEANYGAMMLLGFASILCPLFIFWLMKKRKYFVDTARWVNKIRTAYLVHKPYGIGEPADLAQTENAPQYFSKSSTHIILLFFTAFYGAIVASLFFYSTMKVHSLPSANDIFPLAYLSIIFLMFFLYCAWIVVHLKGLEKK